MARSSCLLTRDYYARAAPAAADKESAGNRFDRCSPGGAVLAERCFHASSCRSTVSSRRTDLFSV